MLSKCSEWVWNLYKIALKLLWNCSEIALKLLWNCTSTGKRRIDWSHQEQLENFVVINKILETFWKSTILLLIFRFIFRFPELISELLSLKNCKCASEKREAFHWRPTKHQQTFWVGQLTQIEFHAFKQWSSWLRLFKGNNSTGQQTNWRQIQNNKQPKMDRKHSIQNVVSVWKSEMRLLLDETKWMFRTS